LTFRAQRTRHLLSYPMALDLFVRLVSAARSLTFRRRQKSSHALSNVPFIASLVFNQITFLPLLQVRLKRSPNFKRRRDSSLTSAPFSLDPTEFTIYTDQEWMVDTSITSPRVQIESRNGSSTSSFLEDQVDNPIIYSTSRHHKTEPSLLPPPALPELPLVLNGPTEPTDIKNPQGIEPDFTKGAQRASRWRRKIKSAISQK
jgi:hypothetical protein